MSTKITFHQAVKLQMKKYGIGNSANSEVEWGSASLLSTLDLRKLSRAKLKRHLSARGEQVIGNKKTLVERLKASLEDERLMGIAYEEEVEAKHRQVADREEGGAVYVVGSNHVGQLGLGDLEHRDHYTVVPMTRGIGVCHVSCADSSCFAVTESHSVYTWGGSGVGPMGLKSVSKEKSKFETPQLIDKLEGEEIIMTATGASHACAASKGGDCFVWGNGKCGVLGLGDFENHTLPVLLHSFKKTDEIKAVASGENHTCALSVDGEVYTWGHSANGRLGLGRQERVNVPDEKKKFFPLPSKVSIPSQEPVTQIACGFEHTIAVTSSGVFSWGVGDGGRLGHGDCSDRWEPCRVSYFDRWKILDVSAGIWHSACVVAVPPMKGVGWVYTWGSGFHGQLGQDKVSFSPIPALVEDFCATQLCVKNITCGSHHNAAITSDGELYTWGYNLNGCLGHSIDEKHVSFTPHPGHCGGFGAIVNRIGRGLPRSVACGKGYTIVATFPYDGPNEKEAKTLMEKHQLCEEERREREKIRLLTEEKEKNEALARNRRLEEIHFLTGKRLCTIDPNCPGFQVHALKPSICRECGHSSMYHTIVEEDNDEFYQKESDQLRKLMGSKAEFN